MDLKNLKRTQNVLIEHMKNHNYSDSYINAFKRELRDLIEKSTEDESYLQYYKRIIEPHRKNLKRNNRNASHRN